MSQEDARGQTGHTVRQTRGRRGGREEGREEEEVSIQSLWLVLCMVSGWPAACSSPWGAHLASRLKAMASSLSQLFAPQTPSQSLVQTGHSVGGLDRRRPQHLYSVPDPACYRPTPGHSGPCAHPEDGFKSSSQCPHLAHVCTQGGPVSHRLRWLRKGLGSQNCKINVSRTHPRQSSLTGWAQSLLLTLRT